MLLTLTRQSPAPARLAWDKGAVVLRFRVFRFGACSFGDALAELGMAREPFNPKPLIFMIIIIILFRRG